MRAESELTEGNSVRSKNFKESLKTRLYNSKKREAKKNTSDVSQAIHRDQG
jgi:hypothetical protein